MVEATELATATSMLQRALAKGFHGKVYFEDGQPAGPFTASFSDLAVALQLTATETVVFAAPPARKGDLYAHRGYVTFTWGHGPEDVVSDFSDNVYVREIVGVPVDA